MDAVAKMVNTGARSMVLKPETLRNYKDFAVEAMKGVTITRNDRYVIITMTDVQGRCLDLMLTPRAGISTRRG